MFQFPGFPPHELWIHSWVVSLLLTGFPHSDIKGSMPACGSPLLFAACHVLLRRLVPWHPPCALLRLISLLRLQLHFYPIKSNFLQLVFQDFSRLPYVQLSRCAGDLSPFRILCRILKTIQRIDSTVILRTLWLFASMPCLVLSDCLFYASAFASALSTSV